MNYQLKKKFKSLFKVGATNWLKTLSTI